MNIATASSADEDKEEKSLTPDSPSPVATVSQTALPTEVEEDILARCTPHHLIKLKVVCQFWNDLVSNPWFCRKQLEFSRGRLNN